MVAKTLGPARQRPTAPLMKPAAARPEKRPRPKKEKPAEPRRSGLQTYDTHEAQTIGGNGWMWQGLW